MNNKIKVKELVNDVVVTETIDLDKLASKLTEDLEDDQDYDYDCWVDFDDVEPADDEDFDELPIPEPDLNFLEEDTFTGKSEEEKDIEEYRKFKASLTEDTHTKYAKPEGDRVAAYQNALKYANKENCPFIYGYINNAKEGKFFALEQPIKRTDESEADFKNKYKNCEVIYVAYPKGLRESVEEDTNTITCAWCKKPVKKVDCIVLDGGEHICKDCVDETLDFVSESDFISEE